MSATNLGLGGAIMGGVTAVAASPITHLSPTLVGIAGTVTGVFGIVPAVKAKFEEMQATRRTGHKRKGDNER